MTAVESFHVPSADVMADMSDEELTAILHRCQACVESCTESIDAKEARGLNADGIRNARRQYARGVKTATSLLRLRAGGRVEFEPARPVHNWLTAYHSLKAVNRLIGVCEAEHEALKAWMADDSDGNWDRLEAAHETVERALRDGGEAEG